MKERVTQREQMSRTLDANPKNSQQASMDVVLQQYVEGHKPVQRVIQGKFASIVIQREVPPVPAFLYHGTSIKHRASIEESGLGGTYREKSRLIGQMVTRSRDVWFSSDKAKAVGSGGAEIVFKVDTTKLVGSNLIFVRGNETDTTWKYTKVIPYADLEIVGQAAE